MLLLLAISVGLIVYLSLFPWRFVPGRVTGNPLWTVLASWPRLTSRRILLDMVVNVIIYVPVGFFGYLALRKKVSRAMAALVMVALGSALSCAIEMMQVSIPGRVPSALDLVTNSGGTALGVALAMLVERRFRTRTKLSLGMAPARSVSALLIVACFAGYQLYPLMPKANLPRLLRELRGLAAAASFSMTLWATALSDWVAAAVLVHAAAGRGSLPIFCVLLAMVPARLLILGRTVTVSELAAIPAALAARSLLLRAGARQFAIAATVLAGAILWRGVSPSAGGSTTFSWAPFSAVFSFRDAALMFLLKGFRYGALVWLLRAWGWRIWTATAAVVLFLTGIEASQMWIPGHAPETTDPLLALIFGLMLYGVERYRGSAR